MAGHHAQVFTGHGSSGGSHHGIQADWSPDGHYNGHGCIKISAPTHVQHHGSSGWEQQSLVNHAATTATPLPNPGNLVSSGNSLVNPFPGTCIGS